MMLDCVLIDRTSSYIQLEVVNRPKLGDVLKYITSEGFMNLNPKNINKKVTHIYMHSVETNFILEDLDYHSVYTTDFSKYLGTKVHVNADNWFAKQEVKKLLGL